MSDQEKTLRLPTSHELARRLLTLPDLPLITSDDGLHFRLAGVEVDDTASWMEPFDTPNAWIDDQRAVVVYSLNMRRTLEVSDD